MTYCCTEFKGALKRGDIVMVVKRNEYQLAMNIKDSQLQVKFCPYCGGEVNHG